MLLCPAPAVGGGAFVLKAHTTISNALDTMVTPAMNTTGANFIVVGVSSYDSAPSVSDSNSNSYTKAGVSAFNGDNANTSIWYTASGAPVVGTGHTVTITGSALFASAYVLAFSGGVASSFDKYVHADSAAAALSLATGSIFPALSDELVVTVLGQGRNNPTTVTIDSGFTQADPNYAYVAAGGSVGGAMAYFVQTAAAAMNPIWTTTGISQWLGAVAAAFKSSASH